MTIITAAGLASLNDYQSPFNKNGSVITLKKISETDWLLFGDIAEGDSEGFTSSGNALNILEYMYFQPTSESEPIDYPEFESRGGWVSVDATYENNKDPLIYDEQLSVYFPEQEEYLWVGIMVPVDFSGERVLSSGAEEIGDIQQVTLNRDYQFTYDSQGAGSGFSTWELPFGQQSIQMVELGYLYPVDSPQNLLYRKTDGTSFQGALEDTLRLRLSILEPIVD